MKISELIREDLILPEIRASRKEDVIRELAAHLASASTLFTEEQIARVLTEREKLGTTALGEGIAVPHAKIESLDRMTGCFARSRKGIDFGAEDRHPTHFFFVILAPPDCAGDHLKTLARISRLFKDRAIRDRLMAATSAAELYDVITSVEGVPAR